MKTAKFYKEPEKKILRDKLSNFKKKTVMKTMLKESELPKPKPLVVKKGLSKSEIVHPNGLTRPIRGKKGQFMGSESIADKTINTKGDTKVTKRDIAIANRLIAEKKKFAPPRIERSDISFRTVKNEVTGKTYTVGVATSKEDTTQYEDFERLTLYRIYNDGIGYQYRFSKFPPDPKSITEIVATFYNPKTDIIALERALNKYREANR